MMKKFFFALLAVVALTAGTVRAAGGVVFIDVEEVFKRFYKTQLAQDQLRQQSSEIKVEREAMEEEIKDIKDEIEVLRTDSRDETLSEEVREGKRNQLEEKLVELQKKEREIDSFEKLRMQQLDQQNKRMTRKIFDEINDVIVRYSREKSFDAVIDRSAKGRNGIFVVLYAGTAKDITADVIAVLNEGREEVAEKKSIDVPVKEGE